MYAFMNSIAWNKTSIFQYKTHLTLGKIFNIDITENTINETDVD